MSTQICFYCQVELLPSNTLFPQSKTKEHLIAKSNGGGQPYIKDNIVSCCRKCNSFVGNWPVRTKLKFKLFISTIGGWDNIYKILPRKKLRSKMELILGLILDTNDNVHLIKILKARINKQNEGSYKNNS